MAINLPAFYGYYNASSGIAANELALNVVNNNISNANNPDYSRQEVDMTNGNPLSADGYNDFQMPGQLGSGVTVDAINRIHDNLTDTQIRTQNGLYNYQNQMSTTLSSMESVIGEPSNDGISNAMQDFFTSAQTMATTPSDPATRTNFIQSAQSMLQVFQQKVSQLQDVRSSLVGDPSDPGSFSTSQASLTVNTINGDLSSLANLNKEIISVSATGAQPNDLEDERDKLLGDLSKQMNISVDYQPTGAVNVRLGNTLLVQSGQLTNTLNIAQNTGTTPSPTDTPALVTLSGDTTNTPINSQITGGTLGGVLEMGGSDTSTTTVKGLIDNLNTLFTQTAASVNAIQAQGLDMKGNTPDPVAGNDKIFASTGTGTDVSDFTVNQNLINDPTLIAAAQGGGTFAGVGDGRNATNLVNLSTGNIAGLNGTNPSDYFSTVISTLGTHSQAASNDADNLNTGLQQLTTQQQSVQGVNLDEEMVNMMKYQRGFEASAKVLSTMDTVTETIINSIGASA